MKFKLQKTFNCLDMPDKVHDLFMDVNEGTGNNCYVPFRLKHVDKEDEIIKEWLLANGAEESDEVVLISHWW